MHVSAETHNVEQSMKIWALFPSIHSVPRGTVDLAGWSRASFAAPAALALQFGMAAQSHPVQVI